MAEKQYFINFDLINNSENINKFLFGVVNVDLRCEKIIDAARIVARRSFPDMDVGACDINVKAFNNIDVD